LSFGQNLVEILLIPLIDRKYLDKYVSFEGLENIAAGFSRGKGVILLGMHEGSWELSNVICANLGFSFNMFVRNQRYPRLGRLLNEYRSRKGCKVIQRQGGLRQLIEALGRNEAIGMTVDQGGKGGMRVNFFGKNASMPTGAIRLALKYDAALIPVFYLRLHGPYFKIIIGPSYDLKRSMDMDQDTRDNLQALVSIFSQRIRKYPHEYLWSYKIWKYSDQRGILILSDGKVGHLRQAEAAAKAACAIFRARGITVNLDIRQIEFKPGMQKPVFLLGLCLAVKYNGFSHIRRLKPFLKKKSYSSLSGLKPDLVISCGASLALPNLILSKGSLAKSVILMRPPLFNSDNFDLVIMPRHDHPPKRKNVIATEGALNLINQRYLIGQGERLIQAAGVLHTSGQFKPQGSGRCIGLLIGGEAKNFSLGKSAISEVIKQVKSASDDLGAGIFATTSRRTSADIENLLKAELKGYPRSQLLIIANEDNIPETVGGILDLSQILVVSPESISMVSEASSSGKYVIVFMAKGLSRKHQAFLSRLAGKKYIYLTAISDLSAKIKEIARERPPIYSLNDYSLVSKAMEKIL
jgi:KDO2-lipid IV(A) lauroyltransferase